MWKQAFGSTAVVALALGGVVQAQDSVSNNLGGLPGDAVWVWDGTEQCNDYVVDLVPFEASWGTQFGIAPLVKSGKSTVAHFNCLLSAQGLSRKHALAVGFPAEAYMLWENVPGAGVNDDENDAGVLLPASGSSNQFAAVAAEFGYTDAVPQRDYNGIVGAVVNYRPTNPSRLYVHRVTAATNSAGATENRAQFGIGAVDEWGNVMFRADGNESTGPSVLTGVNIFNVGMLERDCALVNYVDDNGLFDGGAGTWIVQHAGISYNTPNIGPESVFGLPYYLGTNFDNQYAYGPAFPPALTTSHFATGVTAHRGALAYMSRNVQCIGGTRGTAGILGKDASGLTRTINVWGLNSDGSVAAGSQRALTLPTTITDNVTGATNIPSAGGDAFDHYHDQTAFRGGNSPVALNVDQAGCLLAAGVVYEPSPFNDNPLNYVAVARVSCSPAQTRWTMAGYTIDQTATPGTGKPILAGPTGPVIGRMCLMDDLPGSAPFGPSISAPMIDSVGNVWFISAVALNKVDSQGQPYIDYDSALLRAVYDPTLFGYRLELVLELGSTFTGLNSGLPWQISFMGIADADSVDSGTAWSGNISEKAHLGVDPSPTLPTRDATSLGGLVVNVEIVYDINLDDVFNDPSSSNYDPTYPADEAYQALVYVGAYQAPPTCPDPVRFVPYPPDGIVDATQAHPVSDTTPCTGVGTSWQPITVDLGVSGAADLSCWDLCETGFSPQCGANSITSVLEGPAGVYTINLAHGISAYDVGAAAPAVGVGHVTTIRYNGGAFVKYYKHPGNVDGSSFTNAQDITQLIQRLNIALGGGSVPLWEADINQSGTITVADLTAEINLLNGASLYDVWFSTPKPTGDGCP
ncbi:MAG TPA: hypothetical protein PKK06_02940 [Phycisphaerae bacterium]|nr:hypothetical protein [Phycisphaerae bacterium]HNU44642.1 hypothetical protein [Phycisphaerae bacterium]